MLGKNVRKRVVMVFAALITVAMQSLAGLLDTVERISPSVVGVGTAFPERVPTGGRPVRQLLGTGFAVRAQSLNVIITNAHVVARELDVERGEQIAVFVGRGGTAEQRFADVLAVDYQHDLAVLGYEGPAIPPMMLAPAGTARVGERVAFTGFPIGGVLGLYAATHEGIVSAITPIARAADRGGDLTPVQIARLRDPYEVYQLDAIAYPGNSGSAVYRSDSGEVIGILNSVFVKESRESVLSRPSGIAYAVPVKYLKPLLASVVKAVD